MPYRTLAGIAEKYAKPIVVLWTVCFVICGYFAGKLPGVLKDHGLWPPGYRETREELADRFGIPAEPVILLFENNTAVSPPMFRALAMNTLERMKHVPGLRDIRFYPAAGGEVRSNFAYAVLSFDPSFREWPAVVVKIRDLLPRSERIAVTLTGPPVIQDDVNRTSRSDLRTAEMLGIPLAFLVLLVSFGGVVSALIPILTGCIGVTVTMGLLFFAGSRIELSVFVLNVIPMVGLALSIDFALLVVGRYREEADVFSASRALANAMDTAGRAVTVSSMCLASGLAATLLIPMPMFRSVAIGALTVLAVSWLMNLTLVPALLALAGDRVRAEQPAKAKPIESNVWYRLSGMMMRRPVRTLCVSSLFICCCLLPLPVMTTVIPDAASLPKDNVSRQASETWDRQFQPPNTAEAYLLTKRENALQIQHLLEQDSRIIGYKSVSSPGSPGEVLTVAALGSRADSASAAAWVRDMKSRFAGMSARLAGEPVYEQEIRDGLKTAVRSGIPLLLIANYLIQLFAFRSFLLPLKAIALNLLTICSAFGIMTWIFQEGLFGMDSSGVAIMIPVFVFGLAFGVSMDYGVFLMSRIAEIYRRTGDNERAIREGLARTGKMITSAAAILICVTVPFVMGDVAGVKQLGVGLSAAILLDATVVRLVLVPSLMKLLGRWNWRGL